MLLEFYGSPAHAGIDLCAASPSKRWRLRVSLLKNRVAVAARQVTSGPCSCADGEPERLTVEYLCDEAMRTAWRYADPIWTTRIPIPLEQRRSDTRGCGAHPQPPAPSVQSLHLLLYRLNEMTHSKVLATVRSGAPLIIPGLSFAVPVIPCFIAGEPLAGAQLCSMHPPVSRLTCGNKFAMGGDAWRYRRRGSRPSRNQDDTPTAMACTSTSTRRDASHRSCASRSTDADAISDWEGSRPSAWLVLARRQRTTGPPLQRAAIPWPRSARLRCRPSGRPPGPSMR